MPSLVFDMPSACLTSHNLLQQNTDSIQSVMLEYILIQSSFEEEVGVLQRWQVSIRQRHERKEHQLASMSERGNFELSRLAHNYSCDECRVEVNGTWDAQRR